MLTRNLGKSGEYVEDTKLVEMLPQDLAFLNVRELESAERALESMTRDLVGSYARADDDRARQKLQSELAEAVEKHFQVRQEIREREIAELEAQVGRLRDLLEKRNQAKQTIVQTRLNQLLQAAKGLGWDVDLGGLKKPASSAWQQPANVQNVLRGGRRIPGPARPVASPLLPAESAPGETIPTPVPAESAPGETIPSLLPAEWAPGVTIPTLEPAESAPAAEEPAAAEAPSVPVPR